MASTLVFDVETQRLVGEVGGWGHIRRLGLSVAVTYDPEREEYRTYLEDQARDLVAALRNATLIVGFNVLHFDYEVLRAYTGDPLLDLPTVDILQHLYRSLGWRPRLDDVARATLGIAKAGDGFQAVEWYRSGQMDKLMDYCRRDVEATWRIYDFGRRNRFVRVPQRGYQIRTVPVTWK